MLMVGDHKTAAEILLDRGNEMARGHVVSGFHDASGNIMDRADEIPILNNTMYQVEFSGANVTKLTANFIAVNLFPVQCR